MRLNSIFSVRTFNASSLDLLPSFIRISSGCSISSATRVSAYVMEFVCFKIVSTVSDVASIETIAVSLSTFSEIEQIVWPREEVAGGARVVVVVVEEVFVVVVLLREEEPTTPPVRRLQTD